MMKFLFFLLLLPIQQVFATDPDPGELNTGSSGTARTAPPAPQEVIASMPLAFSYLGEKDYANATTTLEMLASSGSFQAAAVLFALSNQYKGKALGVHRGQQIKITDPKLSALLNVSFLEQQSSTSNGKKKKSSFSKDWVKQVPQSSLVKMLYGPGEKQKAHISIQLLERAEDPILLEKLVTRQGAHLVQPPQKEAALQLLTNYGLTCDFQSPPIRQLLQYAATTGDLARRRFYCTYMALYNDDLSFSTTCLPAPTQVNVLRTCFPFRSHKQVAGILVQIEKIQPSSYIACVQEAARMGNVMAIALEANIFYRGLHGAPKDIERSLTLYKEAADHGLAAAQHNYAAIFYLTNPKTPDFLTTVRLYRQKAAQQNFPPAMLEYSQMLCKGEGGPQNIAEGLRLLKTLINLDPSNGRAHYNYAYFLYNQDRAAHRMETFAHSKLALDNGCVTAQNLYAELLVDERRFAEAFFYYNKVVERNPSSVIGRKNLTIARYMCGALLRNKQVAIAGKNPEQTRATIRNYFMQAAQDGHMPSQYYLGVMSLEEGDFETARSYFQAAADQGFSRAKARLLSLSQLFEEVIEDVDPDTNETYHTATYLVPTKEQEKPADMSEKTVSPSTAAGGGGLPAPSQNAGEAVVSSPAEKVSVAPTEALEKKKKIKTRPPVATATVHLQVPNPHEELASLTENLTPSVHDKKARAFLENFLSGSQNARGLNDSDLLHALQALNCTITATKSGFMAQGTQRAEMQDIPAPTFSWHNSHGKGIDLSRGRIRRVLEYFLNSMGYYAL